MGDKDKSPVILEQFRNVTLDPDSPRYIAKVIGDRYPQYNDTLGKVELKGNYPNISNLIRVEVADAVAGKSTSPKLSPVWVYQQDIFLLLHFGIKFIRSGEWCLHLREVNLFV